MKKYGLMAIILISLLIFGCTSKPNQTVSSNNITSLNFSSCSAFPYGGFSVGDCYMMLGTAGNDSRLCEPVKESENKEWCLAGVGKGKGDFAICDKLTIVEARNNCYAWGVYNNPDITACEKISSNQEFKDWCYDTVAYGRNDVTICDKIEGLDVKETCLMKVGGKTKNLDVCNKLNDSKKDICIGSVAEESNDSTLCMRIQNEAFMDNCYFQVAVQGTDPLQCDKIKSSLSKDSCISLVEKNQNVSK